MYIALTVVRATVKLSINTVVGDDLQYMPPGSALLMNNPRCPPSIVTFVKKIFATNQHVETTIHTNLIDDSVHKHGVIICNNRSICHDK